MPIFHKATSACIPIKNTLFSLTAGLLLAAGIVVAQAQTPVLNANQRNERARSRQGVATGELTRPEAARMRGREAGVTADKRAARADGVVTSGERHEIRGDERRTSRAIYRQKHDGQMR